MNHWDLQNEIRAFTEKNYRKKILSIFSPQAWFRIWRAEKDANPSFVFHDEFFCECLVVS